MEAWNGYAVVIQLFNVINNYNIPYCNLHFKIIINYDLVCIYFLYVSGGMADR